MTTVAPLLGLSAVALLSACAAHEAQSLGSPLSPPSDYDLPIARAPYDSVEVNWKHRLDQPYVYVESRGSYTQVGRTLEALFAAVAEHQVEVCGPPFALYFDDPGKVAPSELRLRACLPVASAFAATDKLSYDVLPSTTVAYAYVSGPYPEAPRAYPTLYAFLRKMNWVENGPVREIYLLNPAQVKDWSELVCEIQLPAGLSR